MIKNIIELFKESSGLIKEKIKILDNNTGYGDLLKTALSAMNEMQNKNGPNWHLSNYDYYWNLEHFIEIDFGHYQGSLQFIFSNNSYQPSSAEIYWTEVNYGSCSGCDTLWSIKEGNPDEMYDGYFTLILHMVQNIKTLSR